VGQRSRASLGISFRGLRLIIIDNNIGKNLEIRESADVALTQNFAMQLVEDLNDLKS
jgi:hypothetical protein